MPFDTSFYPTAQSQPTNPLDTLAAYSNVKNSLAQNQLLHQHIQQQQMLTAQTRDEQGALQSLQNYKNADGKTYDYNPWLSDVAANHPLAMNSALQLRNQQTALVNAGIIPQGQPGAGAPRQVSQEQEAGAMGGGNPQLQQQPSTGIPQGVPTSNDPFAGSTAVQSGLAPGYATNQAAQQEHYQNVQKDADAVPVENAALKNVLNISKAGAPTGTMIGQIYAKLEQSGIVPSGIDDAASQLQQIKSHLAQVALAGGMPGSDARLQALESANLDSSQLPQTIQSMVPYLIGINNSKVAQANYYRKQDPTGQNPDQIAKSRTTWQNIADPRAFEYEELSPADRKKYADTLDPADAAELVKKRQALKSIGAFDVNQ